MRRRRRAAPAAARLAALGIVILLAGAPAARAERLEAHAGDGRIVVNVHKKGLLSGFAHDHRFEVTKWRAMLDLPDGDPAAASVSVVLDAGSLHDRQRGLSEDDRRKVDAQAAGPEVLDAAHHPTVEFRSERIELAPGASGRAARGTVHGTLTARGRTVPADVRFEAERARDAWLVRGSARVKQSDLGIRPFSGFGGTVAVKDELDLEIAIAFRTQAPGSSGTASAAPAEGRGDGGGTGSR